MNNVLITGANSSIGKAIEQQLKVNFDLFQVDVVDTINGTWHKFDFDKYQTVINVAGIVHKNHGQTDPNLYFAVNRDMAIDIATKAKNAGVKQFVQLSTMSVYGLETGCISKDTKENPMNNYAISKLEADKKLLDMTSDNFIVTIVRPPMVYGFNAPGNYNKMSKFIKRIKIFPNIKNKRSFIYIENLAKCIEAMIVNKSAGIFHPQNNELISTLDLAKTISEVNNQKLVIIPNCFGIFNILKLFPILNKVFGTLYYDETVRTIKVDQIDFKRSIQLTENKI